MLLRALVVSNLVTIHLKTGIGSLPAYCGDGIAVKGVENTIRTVSAIAREGMRAADNEIIHIMMGNE